MRDRIRRLAECAALIAILLILESYVALTGDRYMP